MKNFFVTLLLIFISVLTSNAQIIVDNTTYSVEELVQNILLSPDSNAIISNIEFSGVYGTNNFYQISHFITNTTTNTEMNIPEGVLLTSGTSDEVTFPLGMDPGLDPIMSQPYVDCTDGEIREIGTCSTLDNDLSILCGIWPYYNACVLEFDFIPNSAFIEFNYVFGSEEYQSFDGTSNYQCTQFNDKFGFLISGPNISGGAGYDNDAVNIARLENGAEVSINSVNNGIVGYGAFGDPSICLESNPNWVENVSDDEYNGTIDGTTPNGNTNVLTAFQDGLIANETYHIKLIITDVSDGLLDSVVYLQAGSFNTIANCNAGPNQELCNTESTTISATSPSNGIWNVISGTGNFLDATNPTTMVSNLSFGDNIFEWSLDDNTCSSEVTITNNPLIEPNFNPIEPICIGDTIQDLPTTSTNGISGSWTPELNNTETTTYTFTPSNNECASLQTLTIEVNPLTVPVFDSIGPICNGDSIESLPTTSVNGVSGSWSPELNNTETTTYTFTPNNDECASVETLTIEVFPNLPIFDSILPICIGDPLMELPLVSNNGISGSWSPEINALETTMYTFTPNIECVEIATLTIEVNPLPDFEISSFCRNNDYTLEIIPLDGIDPVTVEWYDTDNINIGSGNSIIVSDSGLYEAEVYNSHCALIKSIDIQNASCFIPDGISPNEDGKNDTFDLTGLNVRYLTIFNRYGLKVYEKENYVNEWKGEHKNGNILPTGTYYYIVDFFDQKPRIGWVYLNR